MFLLTNFYHFRSSKEALESDIRSLRDKVSTVTTQIHTTDETFQGQIIPFLQVP